MGVCSLDYLHFADVSGMQACMLQQSAEPESQHGYHAHGGAYIESYAYPENDRSGICRNWWLGGGELILP